MVAECGIDTDKIETRLFINNEFVNAKSGKTFNSVDPSTEEVICSVQEAGKEDVEAAVRTHTQPRQDDQIMWNIIIWNVVDENMCVDG